MGAPSSAFTGWYGWLVVHCPVLGTPQYTESQPITSWSDTHECTNTVYRYPLTVRLRIQLPTYHKLPKYTLGMSAQTHQHSCRKDIATVAIPCPLAMQLSVTSHVHTITCITNWRQKAAANCARPATLINQYKYTSTHACKSAETQKLQ